MMSPIEEILPELRAGKMIVLVDDESRENEGDLVCAAEKTTPDMINFMAKYARGLICLPMTGAKADALGLHPQTNENTSQFTTAFTVSIDAAEGITTGISAADRAHTVQLAAKDDVRPMDMARPAKDIRLASRPMAFMTMNVRNSDRGRASRMISAPRMFLRNKYRIMTTSRAPSRKARVTVFTLLWTISDRS